MDDADEIDVDVAGVYIIGLGSDADMPTFTYTDTDGEFVIGAANVTVHNLRFVAGISGVTMGISIEAAGDNAKISNCDFPESGTSTYEFTDGIDLASGADGVIITGCEYYNADTTGAAHFIEMGNGVNNDIEISNNVIYGEFSVSAIWSDTVDLEVLIKDNVITNLTSDQHAIEFTGAATGTICGNKIYTNAEGTSIDPGSMKCIENYVTTTTDASGMLYPAVDDGVAQLNATTIAKIMGDGVTYTNPNYLTVSADCTNATWKSIAAHEIAVVTGTVRMWIVVEATSGVSSAAEGAHISLGCAGNTAEVIAATDAHLFAAGDVWGGTTPSVGMETSLDVIHDFVVVNGTDVGYTVADEALTAGTMVFHIWWVPLSSTGAVTAGAGGAF